MITSGGWRHAVTPVLCLAAVIYFGYHAVQGDRGLVAWFRLTQQVARAETIVNTATDERHRLERMTRLLRPESLDADLLDERARHTLGFAKPAEVIILLP
jgi:cell division protein FtsB